MIRSTPITKKENTKKTSIDGVLLPHSSPAFQFYKIIKTRRVQTAEELTFA